MDEAEEKEKHVFTGMLWMDLHHSLSKPPFRWRGQPRLCHILLGKSELKRRVVTLCPNPDVAAASSGDRSDNWHRLLGRRDWCKQQRFGRWRRQC